MVKRLLIAYFIGNISAKNIEMCSLMSKLQQTKDGTFFGDTVYKSIMNPNYCISFSCTICP